MRRGRRQRAIPKNLRTSGVAVSGRDNHRSVTFGVLCVRVSPSLKKKIGDVSLGIGCHAELSNKMKWGPTLGICDTNISPAIQKRPYAVGPSHATRRMENRGSIEHDDVGVHPSRRQGPDLLWMIVVDRIGESLRFIREWARWLATIPEARDSDPNPARHSKDQEQKPDMRAKAKSGHLPSEDHPSDQCSCHGNRNCEHERHSFHQIRMLRRRVPCDNGLVNRRS